MNILSSIKGQNKILAHNLYISPHSRDGKKIHGSNSIGLGNPRFDRGWGGYPWPGPNPTPPQLYIHIKMTVISISLLLVSLTFNIASLSLAVALSPNLDTLTLSQFSLGMGPPQGPVSPTVPNEESPLL